MSNARRLADARQYLTAIRDYGDEIGTCSLCEQDIDSTGLKEAQDGHLPECPFEWARQALLR